MDKGNEWLWNTRCTQWVFKITENRSDPLPIAPCMDPYFVGGIDPDEMKKGAKAFKKAGINMVLTEGLRRLMLFENQGKTDQVIDTLGMAADACHREGIKIIHHTTCTFVDQNIDALPEAQLKWLSVDGLTGKPAYLELWGGWYLWCLNNPDFRAEYFRLCERTMKEAKLDGFMVDEVYFRKGWHHCTCSHCRDKYQKTAGYVLPEADATAFWGNFENAAFRAWLSFRCASVGDFYQDLHKVLGKVHSHPVLMGCKSSDILENEKNFGDSTTNRMRGINTLFVEPSGSNTSLLHCWRFLSANMMIYVGLSESRETPTITTMYHRASERFLAWALRLCHGMRVWATSSVSTLGDELGPNSHLLNFPEDLDAFSKLFAWERKHEKTLNGKLSPFANIAVFYGESSQTLVNHGVFLDGAREFMGWCEFLTDENTQYAVLLKNDLSLSRLRDFDLVILPNAVCLNQKARKALLTFVKTGGNLIFSNKTGERNDDGTRVVDSLRLAAELGILDGGSEASTTARFGRLGKGKWVCFHHKPSVAAFTNINSTDATKRRDVPEAASISDQERLERKRLTRAAIDWSLDDPAPLVAKQIPDGLLIKGFRKSDNDDVIIHILNVSGENAIDYGEHIPATYNVEFPEIKEDIVLRLNIKSPKQARLISPDWNGSKRINVKKLDGDACRLTIPPNSFRRHAVLHIKSS